MNRKPAGNLTSPFNFTATSTKSVNNNSSHCLPGPRPLRADLAQSVWARARRVLHSNLSKLRDFAVDVYSAAARYLPPFSWPVTRAMDSTVNGSAGSLEQLR